MSKRVLKYVIKVDRPLTIPLTEGWKYLHTDSQYSNITMWLEVPDSGETKEHTFEIVATGQPIKDSAEHKGSILNNGYVWHIYEMFSEE